MIASKAYQPMIRAILLLSGNNFKTSLWRLADTLELTNTGWDSKWAGVYPHEVVWSGKQRGIECARLFGFFSNS